MSRRRGAPLRPFADLVGELLPALGGAFEAVVQDLVPLVEECLQNVLYVGRQVRP